MKKIFLTLCLSCLLISTMFVSTYATTMNVADNYLETDNYILKRENSSEKLCMSKEKMGQYCIQL